jgi:hypothetical protein
MLQLNDDSRGVGSKKLENLLHSLRPKRSGHQRPVKLRPASCFRLSSVCYGRRLNRQSLFAALSSSVIRHMVSNGFGGPDSRATSESGYSTIRDSESINLCALSALRSASHCLHAFQGHTPLLTRRSLMAAGKMSIIRSLSTEEASCHLNSHLVPARD